MPEEVQRKAELTIVLLFFVALAGAGIVLIIMTVQDFARARSSFTWPEASAVVLSDPEHNSARPRYVYVVGGETYESRRIGFFRLPIPGGKHAQLAPGDNVTIYVDPDNPSIAVLQPGGSSLVFLLMSLAAAVLVFFGAGGAIRTLMNSGEDDWAADDASYEGDLAQ